MADQQPGWYPDPKTGSLRYWDGEQWSNFENADNANNTIKEHLGSEPSDGAFKLAMGVTSICKFLQGIVWFAFGLFILLVIVVTVFGLGNWTLAGTPLIVLGSGIGQFAVLGFIFVAAVVVPVIYAMGKIIKNKVLFGVVHESSSQEISMVELEELHYMQRLMRLESNCNMAASFLAAVIALFAHDGLMGLIGNPWADILTVVIVLAGGVILSSLITGTAMKKLACENPELHQAYLASGLFRM